MPSDAGRAAADLELLTGYDEYIEAHERKVSRDKWREQVIADIDDTIDTLRDLHDKIEQGPEER
jgi:hypothetical protein